MSHYEALKSYGFSPAKAAEIDLDAQRGDQYAKHWVKVALAGAACQAPSADLLETSS